MKRVILILMVACLLALGGQSFAELCTIDAVPAATLLLPVFKSDISDYDGDGRADCGNTLDTLFSINNASAAPALAHVILWTDWSWPSLDFDVFLTGFDMQSVSMCQVIGRGNLPVTADEQNDPADTISPGLWGLDGSFPDCLNVFPFPEPIVTGALLERVQNAHSGYPLASLGGLCTGEQLNGAGQCVGGSCPAGTIARGYVTVDNVSRCSINFPFDTSPAYFIDGGGGIANNINQLWGDYFKVDPANNFAQGDNLVHIEADDSLGVGGGGPNSVTGYTFYGRYTTGGADNREPLGTTWAARYLNGGPFDGGTKFSVWRDSTDFLGSPNVGYNCGLCFPDSGIGPAWCPLNETQVVCFDEAEDCEELCFGEGVISPPPPNDPFCFPLESNHVQVGVGDLTPSWPFGWCYLNLNHSFGAPPLYNGIAQSYVSVSHDALGRFSVGYAAIELTNACSDLSPILATP